MFRTMRRDSLGLAVCLLILCCGGLGAAPFIDSSTLDVRAILPPPPKPGSEQYRKDTGFLKDARAVSTKGQFDRGMTASHDSVFDYAETLGPWFNAGNLPLTTKLFVKVDGETEAAIERAKRTFKRKRPPTWKETGQGENKNGFSYPSGHTTRAFVWAILLSDAFPEETKALYLQARRKAWYRVILGRHFPDDVHAGKVYGKFLAGQFLQSRAFRKEWGEVCQEMRKARLGNAPASPALPPRTASPDANGIKSQ